MWYNLPSSRCCSPRPRLAIFFAAPDTKAAVFASALMTVVSGFDYARIGIRMMRGSDGK
jgi:hypothetical protein